MVGNEDEELNEFNKPIVLKFNKPIESVEYGTGNSINDITRKNESEYFPFNTNADTFTYDTAISGEGVSFDYFSIKLNNDEYVNINWEYDGETTMSLVLTKSTEPFVFNEPSPLP